MPKVLVLFAHPVLERSRVHKMLIKGIRNIPGVQFHDLYEAYPDFDIDVGREQRLLLENDIIIFQHPFYWYSCPAIIKQWLDLVLEHNWAYGPEGKALSGKFACNVISCGGSKEAYHHEGRNRFTIPEFLAPFEQTARLCHMQYLPPFVIHGTHRLRKEDMDVYAFQYEQILRALAAGSFGPNEWENLSYLNDLIPARETI